MAKIRFPVTLTVSNAFGSGVTSFLHSHIVTGGFMGSISSVGQDGGMQKTFTGLVPNTPVTVTLHISALAYMIAIGANDGSSMGGAALGAAMTVTMPGTYTYTFTPTSSTATLSLGGMMSYLNQNTTIVAVGDVSYTQAGGVVTSPQLVQLSSVGKDRYEFGAGTQMKTNEIAGMGNHYTAPFWEYNPLAAKRWNRDPVMHPWESPYAVYGSNPILFNDVEGDEYYKTKGGTPQYVDHKLTKEEQTAQGYIKDLGKEFSGHTEDGSGIRGYKDGTIILNHELPSATVTAKMGETGRARKAHEYREWQNMNYVNVAYAAAHPELGIGINLEARARANSLHDAALYFCGGEAVATVAAPVIIYTAPTWGSALLQGVRWTFSTQSLAAGGASGLADASSQLTTLKDIRDYNIAQTISQTFLKNPFGSALVGSTVNWSYNSLVLHNKPVVNSLTDYSVQKTIIIGTLSNTMGNYLGKGFHDIPVLPGMSKWGKFGGNYISDNVGAWTDQGTNNNTSNGGK